MPHPLRGGFEDGRETQPDLTKGLRCPPAQPEALHGAREGKRH